MTSTSHRFLIVLAATTLACSPPPIESVGTGGSGGGSTGGAGGAAGSDNGGTGGSQGNGKDGPDFNVNFGDGGAPDGGISVIDPEGPSCAGEVHQGKLIPLDLMLLVDISGSMEEAAGMKSKWGAVHDALVSFVKDQKSTGLGVALMTFPPPTKECTKDGDCAMGEIRQNKGVCSMPANVATTEVACDDGNPPNECLADVPCTKYGLCALSGLRCAGIGMPCAGGAAGDTCVARPHFCMGGPNQSCPVTLYEKPVVPFGELPAAAPTLEMALGDITPQGTTPTTPAVQGAMTQLRARAMANPDRKPVLVLATDGLPTMCGFNNTVDTAVTAIGTGQMGMPVIPTYVIGVFGANQLPRSQPALNRMAMAGGTGMPFALTTGNDLTQRFLDAINQIRGSALGCEFAIPKPGANMNTDYGKVNVRVTTTTGPEDLVYVGSADKCDPMRGGWYYDADPKVTDPTRVLLCASTCGRVKMVAVSVELRVGCNTIIK